MIHYPAGHANGPPDPPLTLPAQTAIIPSRCLVETPGNPPIFPAATSFHPGSQQPVASEDWRQIRNVCSNSYRRPPVPCGTGSEIDVERLPVEEGATIDLTDVLLVVGDNGQATIGQPTVEAPWSKRPSSASSAGARFSSGSTSRRSVSASVGAIASTTPGCASTASAANGRVIRSSTHGAQEGRRLVQNGRDSQSKRLGVKRFGGEYVIPGTSSSASAAQFHPGKNVGIGRDYTIFATAEGYVVFERFGRNRKRISVLPEQPQAAEQQA